MTVAPSDTRPPADAASRPPATRWYVLLARVLGMLLFAFGTWTLPAGDRLWIVALFVPAFAFVVSGAVRADPALPLAPIGSPGGVWWGMAAFVGLLPNYDRVAARVGGLPRFDVPYRPDVLYALLVILVALASGMAAYRLVRAGWAKPRAVVVALTSLALAVASAFAALWIGR